MQLTTLGSVQKAVTVCASVLLISTSLGAIGQEKLPKSAELTKQAWLLYEPSQPKPGEEPKKPDYVGSIKLADQVIEEFRADAKQTQEDLEAKVKKKETSEPPLGKPKTQEAFDKVMENGPINDVASCYFIKAMSHIKLKEYKQARKAFESGGALTMGRAWDPGPDPKSTGYPGYNKKGWFWSPATGCKAQLADMDREKL